ncbi:hypothetical protein JAAARDRAFT_188444 [Jaapia argillacea MUCL 33604]|uniref:Uncharacterized protein n=1 Tax=Jaapia argillacea MUCL 33604 TaxID=933084 RepID=A0A067QG71_9AGAM|nr:hypothetical protein JAAARDRAFT_188444 [Jaapia argillacea MUCL 33604]
MKKCATPSSSATGRQNAPTRSAAAAAASTSSITIPSSVTLSSMLAPTVASPTHSMGSASIPITSTSLIFSVVPSGPSSAIGSLPIAYSSAIPSSNILSSAAPSSSVLHSTSLSAGTQYPQPPTLSEEMKEGLPAYAAKQIKMELSWANILLVAWSSVRDRAKHVDIDINSLDIPDPATEDSPLNMGADLELDPNFNDDDGLDDALARMWDCCHKALVKLGFVCYHLHTLPQWDNLTWLVEGFVKIVSDLGLADEAPVRGAIIDILWIHQPFVTTLQLLRHSDPVTYVWGDDKRAAAEEKPTWLQWEPSHNGERSTGTIQTEVNIQFLRNKHKVKQAKLQHYREQAAKKKCSQLKQPSQSKQLPRTKLSRAEKKRLKEEKQRQADCDLDDTALAAEGDPQLATKMDVDTTPNPAAFPTVYPSQTPQPITLTSVINGDRCASSLQATYVSSYASEDRLLL